MIYLNRLTGFNARVRAAGGGTVDTADLHDIYYTTDPSGSVDAELRKLTPAGTDSQIVASLATLVDPVQAASNGPFGLHGYLARQGKLVFSDEDAFGWRVDVDGTNLEQIPKPATSFHQWGAGLPSKAAIYKGSIYVGGGGGSVFRIIDHHSGGYAEPDNVGVGFLGNARKIEYDPTARRIFNLTDEPEINFCDEDAQTVTAWEHGATDPMYCVVNDAVNSDASTGGIWMIADKTPGAGNEDLKYYSIDNHTDGAADELATLDLLGSGSPIGAVSDIVDMMYDEDNGVVYLLVNEGGGTSKIYAFYHGESVVPADITLIGAVSADAIGRAHMVFVRDSYAETSLTISDLAPVIWLDAADAEDAGGATPDEAEVVAAWPDKSGNGNDVTSIGGSPVYDADVANLNNLPAVSLDGTDDYLRIPDGTVEYPFTVMAVFEQQSGQSVNGGYVLWTGDRASSTDNTFSFFIQSGNIILFTQDGGNSEITDEDITDDVGNVLSLMDFGLDLNGDPKYLIRTTDPDSDSVYQAGGFPLPVTADMNTPQMIGARPDPTLPSTARFWKAKLAEYVVVNRRIYIAEWEAIRDQLNTKYNL